MPNITQLPIQKIAVVRALKLGDFLVSTPALRAVRQAFPDAHIEYIGLPWAAELVPRYRELFDGFVPFAGWPGLPELELDPMQVVRFLTDAQAAHYDLVLQLHGNGSNINTMLPLLGATYCAGFANSNSYWPNQEYFMEYPETGLEVDRMLTLLRFLDIDAQDEHLMFPLTAADSTALEKFDLRQPYTCIHPGSISAERWPAERFAAVADLLAEQGLQIVLTGSDSEAALTAAVASAMRVPALDLAGKTHIGALGALLQGSALLVSNDTGVAHVANALDVPSVTIFTTADPGRWAAKDTVLHPYLTLEQATPETVIAHAEKLLQGGHS